MPESPETITKLLTWIGGKYESGNIDDDVLLQIIAQCEGYLSPVTISEYAKQNKLSYNGAKHHRPQFKFGGVRFINDNV